MDGFRYEVAATWKEVRWSAYFLVLLLPAVLTAAGLAALAQGTPTPSPGLLLGFGVPLAFLALIGAGLWDGVMGQLGRYIWWPILLWFALLLLRAFARPDRIAAQAEPPKQKQGRNEGPTRAATRLPRAVVARPGENRPVLDRMASRWVRGRAIASWLREKGVGWRDLRRLESQLSQDSSDPRARELRQLIGV